MIFALHNRAMAALLNHLLDQSPWTRLKIVPYAGKSVAIHLFPISLLLEIGPGGRLRHSASGTADTTLRLQPLQALRIALRDPAANREIEISGDTQLAGIFGAMLMELEWDAEADLARFAGDIVAHKILQAIRRAIRWQRSNAEETVATFMEYATEESPLLAKPQHVAKFVADIDTLRDSHARLQKRMELIAQSVSPH
ncbi:MAG TPA: SCP2 sterol-binding domain-containing protein [Burkholderiales bacterium]|nr:SCP2 sterol-binding domain-containing protein [Burkholderiales bacterium]